MTTYDNAPLNEVVISATIPPILELLPQHIGLLWSELRSEFPTCEQHPTVGMPTEGPGDVFPFPRFWFVSADDTEVLQVQRDKFTVNWRRRGELPYPRFDAVKGRFATYHNKLREFVVNELHTEFPFVSGLEVAYINVLDPSLGWEGMQSLSAVLPEFSPPKLGKSLEPSGVNIIVAATEAGTNNGVMISCRNGNNSTGEPVLILEIKVNTKDVEKSPEDVLTWLSGAHDCVIATFNDLTSKKMQKDVWLKMDLKNA